MRTMVKRRGIVKGIPIGYKTYNSRRAISTTQICGLILLIFIAAYIGLNLGRNSVSKQDAIVEGVIDGDTIEVLIEGKNEKIRLLGIDTPETHHPTKPVGCYGPEAEAFTRANLDQKTVQLEYDVQRNDKYGRSLAYVYVDGQRFNDVLVNLGYAKTLNIDPNNRYANKLMQLQSDAKTHQRGIWKYC